MLVNDVSALDDFLTDQDDDKYIMIKENEVSRRINIDDIIYAEASDKYCFIRTTEEGFLYKNIIALCYNDR